MSVSQRRCLQILRYTLKYSEKVRVISVLTSNYISNEWQEKVVARLRRTDPQDGSKHLLMSQRGMISLNMINIQKIGIDLDWRDVELAYETEALKVLIICRTDDVLNKEFRALLTTWGMLQRFLMTKSIFDDIEEMNAALHRSLSPDTMRLVREKVFARLD